MFIPLASIIRNFHLGDTPWALILTYPTFLIPFCAWLLMGYFKAIPRELEECARIDGATRWKAMVYIIFPIAVPGILSAGIFAFTLSWNEFIYALVFLSSAEEKTVSVGVTSELVRGDVFYWGLIEGVGFPPGGELVAPQLHVLLAPEPIGLFGREEPAYRAVRPFEAQVGGEEARPLIGPAARGYRICR